MCLDEESSPVAEALFLIMIFIPVLSILIRNYFLSFFWKLAQVKDKASIFITKFN